MNDRQGKHDATAEDTLRSAGNGDTPAGCAVRSVAHDADEQARNLVGWRQTYDQLAAGRFAGTLTELPLDTMKLFRETTSHTLRQACEVRGDAYWFGIPVASDGTARIDARPIVADGFACRPGNVEFELLTPARFSIYGVVVRGDYAEQVEQRGLDDALPRTSVIQPDDASLARLRRLLGHWLDDAGSARAALSDDARHELQAAVLAALFDVCAGPAEATPVDQPARRRWIVSLAHRERPIGVPELCEQLLVSRRTLQYCFQDVLGMAPATYLRALRLNGARRDLCGRAAGSVQDVATSWGFGHLSQFATDYRKMFGMRPSEALREAARLN